MARVGAGHRRGADARVRRREGGRARTCLSRVLRTAPLRARGVPGDARPAPRSSTKRAARLGIVSAKRHDIVQLAVEALGFGEKLDIVVGSDEAPRGKPYPDQILVALERLGADPDDTAYVGDAPFDIAAAKNAGVHAIGVTWGGIHTRERMESEGPDAVVDTADELLCRPLANPARGRARASCSTRYLYEYHVLDDPSVSRRRVRPALRRAESPSRRRAPGSSRPTRRPTASVHHSRTSSRR